MNLFPNLAPKTGRLPAGIDLRCCGVEEVLAEVRGARLVIADPPWQYGNNPGRSNPEEEGIYQGLSDQMVATHLDQSYTCALPDSRLAVWYTWPKDAEWRAAGEAGRWGQRKTGGAWTKLLPTSEGARLTSGSLGVGYHWRGQTEPVAIYVRGACGRATETLLNGHVSPPEEHSAKPIVWMRAWIRAWTEPGDLVLDLYAGLGSVAVACALERRRYVGAEIDAERHRRAVLNVERAALGGGA